MVSAVCLWRYFQGTKYHCLPSPQHRSTGSRHWRWRVRVHTLVGRKQETQRFWVHSVTGTEWLTFCRLSSPQRRTRCWVAGVSAHVHTLPCDINKCELLKRLCPISQLFSPSGSDGPVPTWLHTQAMMSLCLVFHCTTNLTNVTFQGPPFFWNQESLILCWRWIIQNQNNWFLGNMLGWCKAT